MRLDLYLSKCGLVKSRSRAAQLISGEFVAVNGKIITKASYDVTDSDEVKLVGEDHQFVGRGGMKLDGALSRFEVDVNGLICADIGASTGGFTDCLLRHGATHVYAVDSGHGQLDESLVKDERVTDIEGCNARYLTVEQLGTLCDCAVSDLSFISQTLVLPAISSVLADGAIYIALIKPQFECGREAVGRGGLVKDKKQHITAIRKVLDSAKENALAPCGIMKSPIAGGDGNTEFLMIAIKNGVSNVSEKDIAEVVYE